MSERLLPSEYRGEDLCPCCGVSPTGDKFVICVDGYPCAETCGIYDYGTLCSDCEERLFDDRPDNI